MRKWMAVIGILVLLLCLAGCLSLENDTISEDDAIGIVKTIVNEEHLCVEAEGYQERNGRTCYYIHAYSLGQKELIHPDTGEPYRQQFTHGWYLVDVQTGDVYDWMTDEPVYVEK